MDKGGNDSNIYIVSLSVWNHTVDCATLFLMPKPRLVCVFQNRKDDFSRQRAS